MEGFSLHAGTWVGQCDREGLEKLCRYAARPAVAESRLSELPDGRIAYSLKTRWKDGTTAVVMTKEVLMERLCALVPKPRGFEFGSGTCLGAISLSNTLDFTVR